MKSLVTTLILIFSIGFAFNAFANEDGTEDQPIDPEEESESLRNQPEMVGNGVADAASAVGDSLNNNPCSTVSYAEMLYCYPAQWLADLLPCPYGAGTAQASICPSHSRSPSTGRSNSDHDEPFHMGPHFELNPDFRPVSAEDEGLRRHLLSHLAKKEEGQVVHRWRDGTRLILRIKLVMSRETDQAFIFEMVNAQDRVIGRPIYFFRGDTLHINDLSRRTR